MFAYASIAALVAGSVLVRAEPVPTSPGPGDVFKQGSQCTIAWTADETGVWKTMDIELMSGSNLQMNFITTVASVDGTDPNNATFSWECPEVTPNSAIYFYQFSTPAAPTNLTWVTRFTLAAADGTTTPPENPTQDGDDIPWGVGKLVDPSKAVQMPPYLSSGTVATTSTSAAVTSSTGTPATVSTPSTNTAKPTGVSSGSAGTPSKAPPAPTQSPSSGASNTTNSTGSAQDNGAPSAFGVDNYIARAGIALSVAAFTFAIAL